MSSLNEISKSPLWRLNYEFIYLFIYFYSFFYFLFNYINGAKTYQEILKPTGARKYDFLDIKCGGDPFSNVYPMSLQTAREQGKIHFDAITLLADLYCNLHSDLKNKPDPYVDKLFDKVQTEIMKKAIKRNLRRKKDA